MLSFLSPFPTLPKYTGPRKVGTADYEIPLSSLGFTSVEDLPAATVKFRIFYPADPNNEAGCGVPWLPEPQTANLAAYLKLARLGPWLSKILLSVPVYLRSTAIPAYQNPPLIHHDAPLPVLIFSHGLVGGMNTHSALLGELASRGIVCVAIEHRDGSGVLSLVRKNSEEKKAALNGPTEMTSIYFQSISLKIRPGVWEARDRQFSIRILELSATFKALEILNNGNTFRNLACGPDGLEVFSKSALDLEPGKIMWAGHSFGGATLIQFMKTIYHQHGHKSAGEEEKSASSEGSLLLQPPSLSLVEQIKPSSPLVLLDPWFMPLRSPATKNIFARPLPCHDVISPPLSPSTIAVLSSECAWHWPEIHSHMPQILAADPTMVRTETEAETIKKFENFVSARHFMNESKRKQLVPIRDEDAMNQERSATATFVLHNTTHATLSDFGIMFPWITWWFTGQKSPELANRNVVRCILDAAGLQRLQSNPDAGRKEAETQLDTIFY